jgi:hypothetical protein
VLIGSMYFCNLLIAFFVLFGKVCSEVISENILQDNDGYLPVDMNDPDYFHCSPDEDTPSGRLYRACVDKSTKEDPIDIVEKELRLGAYPDVIHYNSKTPVIIACLARNFTKSVRLLADRGGSLLKTESEGWNSCQIACFEGIVDIVRLCYEKGVDLINNSIGAKHHYLHYACAGKTWGHAAATRFLLEIGVDPDVRSLESGATCMEEYADYDNVKDVLLEFGAKTFKMKRKRRHVHEDL